MAIKRIISLILVIFALSSLNGMAPQLKQDPTSVGLNTVIKLYGSHKKNCKNIRTKLDILDARIMNIDDIIKSIKFLSDDIKIKIIRALEKKIKKIEAIKISIAILKNNIDATQNQLKSERTQKNLAFVAQRFLGKDSPDNLSKQTDKLQKNAQEILQKLIV